MQFKEFFCYNYLLICLFLYCSSAMFISDCMGVQDKRKAVEMSEKNVESDASDDSIGGESYHSDKRAKNAIEADKKALSFLNEIALNLVSTAHGSSLDEQTLKIFSRNLAESLYDTIEDANIDLGTTLSSSDDNEEIDRRAFQKGSYELLIAKDSMIALIDRLIEKTTDRVASYAKEIEPIFVAFDDYEKLSLHDAEQMIDTFRKYLSFCSSEKEIYSVYEFFSARIVKVNEVFSEISQSSRYGPWRSNINDSESSTSVYQTVIGYMFLPVQCDHSFESLLNRGRLALLLSFSASHGNLLAMALIFKILESHTELYEVKDTLTTGLKRLEKIMSNITNYSERLGPSFFMGLLCKEHLEFKEALRHFERVLESDERAFYEYYNCKLVASQETALKGGLHCLLKAKNEKKKGDQISCYRAAGQCGVAYGYYCAGDLLKKTRKYQALADFCRAFEFGHYDSLEDLAELSKSLTKSKKKIESDVDSLNKKIDILDETFRSLKISENLYKRILENLKQK